jgi:hypothetical protein
LGADARFALEAIARHFSATWQEGHGSSDAYMAIRGKRVAVEIGLLVPRSAARSSIAKPRLRYDRVALRFVRDVRDRLRQSLASGEAALLSIRAPILQAGKTVAALEKMIRSQRERGLEKAELQTRFSGNRIRVRILRSESGRDSEVFGFVHSAGANPATILNAAQSLLDCLRLKSRAVTAVKQRSDRWLVLVGDPTLGETYRDACSQLSNPTGFARIVLVNGGGRIDVLAG